MKNLLYLLKNNILQISKINLLRYADRSKRNKIICIYCLAGIVVIGLLAYWIHALAPLFDLTWNPEDIIKDLIVPMVLICFVLNIFFSLFWGSGLLYHDKNIDAMLALPVPLTSLIVAKLSVLYFVQAILDLILLFPMIVLLGLTAKMSAVYYLIMAVMVLLLPIIPGLLGTIIGTGIYRILTSSSIFITRIKTIGVILILFCFLIFMFWKFPEIENGRFSISVAHIPIPYIADFFYQGVLSMAVYVTVVFGVGGVLLFCLGKLYHYWYCSAAQSTRQQKLNLQSFRHQGLITTLVSRERTRYFSLPVYLTNTACGFLFAAVFVILAMLAPEKLTSYIQLFAGYFGIGSSEYPVLYIFTITILIALSSTTYASISIEGKEIEILKSLPITAKDIFRGKLYFHLAIAVPVIIVLNTLMATILHYPWPVIILGYIMPVLFSCFIGIAGYILNLLFPNFEWENVTQIIKQSIPAILSALLGMAVTCGSMYFLIKFCPDSLLLGSFAACGILIIIIGVLIVWEMRIGERIWKKL